MRRRNFSMLVAIMAAVLSAALASVAFAQDANDDDDVDPVRLRRAWLFGDERADLTPDSAEALSAPYVLNPEEIKKFKGAWGINFSHYDFDIDGGAECDTQSGYLKPKCSCRLDWEKLVAQGLSYTYSKASDGTSTDLSFKPYFDGLKVLHQKRKLLRGGYHFLRPGISAAEQAETFLEAVGVVNGKNPDQLPPILDLEWAPKRVVEGTPAFTACPANRKTKRDGKYYCDMWYTMSATAIVEMATKWIDIVKAATGREVIIYTNVGAWWNPVLGDKGKSLSEKQAFWLSRYLLKGPLFNPSWDKQNGSAKWKMPPLPVGAKWPPDTYSQPHLWQFTEDGRLPDKVYTCKGKLVPKPMELNWMPVAREAVPALFGLK